MEEVCCDGNMLHSPARGDVDIILFLSEEKLNLMGEEGQL